MKLTVFGASGPIGQQFVDQAVHRGHEVTAVVQPTAPDSRFPDSAQILEADVYAGDDIAGALTEQTVVCNLLQHSKLTPHDYVSVCGRHILEAMKTAGLERYLTVVPATVQHEGDQIGALESLAVSVLRLLRPTVSEDAVDHVADVVSRNINWTVIRVLRVAEGPTTRQYKTGDIKLGVGSVSYGDVAAFLLDCCERGIYRRMQPKVRT